MTRSFPILLLAAAALAASGGSVAAQPSISVAQPGGPGDIAYSVTNVAANAELYTLVSLVPHSPTGTGPIFGLGTGDSQGLINQILQPLGTAPFHVSADALGTYAWTITLPSASVSFNVDIVCVEFGAVGYVSHSSVLNTTIDL